MGDFAAGLRAIFTEVFFGAVVSWLLMTCEGGANSVEFCAAAVVLEADSVASCAGAAVDLA